MQVAVENTSLLGRRLKVQIPATEIQTVVKEKMAELSQKASVAGFRPGKVPKHVLEQRYGPQVRQEAVGKVIENSLPLVLQQNALQPAGRPVVEHISNDLNKDLEYTVFFEIFPEFSLADYSTLEIEKYTVGIKEKDIDNAVSKLKQQFANWVVVSRPAQLGDRLNVDYTSTMNGKPYENNSGKDVLVELGTNVFIEGFEKGLIGASQGEKRTLELTFPKDWRIENLAGAPVQFVVSVKSVEEKQETDDEALAKKLGVQSSDQESIRAKVRDSLQKQIDEVVHNQLKEQVTDALLKLNPIPVPEALVEREMNALHEDLHRRMGDTPQTACQHQGLAEQAQKRVALGLILNEVIKKENLVANEEEVRRRIAGIAKMFGNAEFLESMYSDSEELLSGVRHTVLLDQALDFLVTKATVKEKETSVDNLFKLEVK